MLLPTHALFSPLQVIRCGQLAAGEAALSDFLSTFCPDASTATTHRCCAVLDAPLLPAEHQTLLVVPPSPGAAAQPASSSSSSGGGGGGLGVGEQQSAADVSAGRDSSQGGPAAAVRGLLLSHSTAVCPRGRHLLYLWTQGGCPGGGQPAAEALLPVLGQLADASQLQQQQQQQQLEEQEEVRGEAQAVDQPGDGPGTDGGAGAAPAQQQQQQQDWQQVAAAAADGQADPGGPDPLANGLRRPTVLFAAFYSQISANLTQPEQAVAARRWPANVALCPGPDAAPTFGPAIEAAKRCYWQLFPPAAAGTSAQRWQ